ncbi:MAG TPA: helix-turn-helix transcriptional regulator [Solirubrobacteraceae bacterium]|nr:helix-turn-helix transcriptional regulator [Solirubrobacteraceae bacterium]
MPARHDPNAKAETMLARVRLARGVTQEELADAIGISLPTYRRLERNDMDNPGIRYLANAALALGVELDVLIEDEWREWMVFDGQRHAPPRYEEFWRRPFPPGQAHLDDLREQGRLA